MKTTEALTAASHEASILGADTRVPARPASSQPQAPGLSSATTFIHENPWSSALLALGGGILLGLLGRRLANG